MTAPGIVDLDGPITWPANLAELALVTPKSS
ncbi:hypothetical protein J2Z21_008904 [Streptomyces griseochromogenes]|uniref:Uncharacterized protein n=1 Tax=Streptomyces griseochromogenes TaxID=68214 RepID=A0ABS4M8B7_9ACTN|nr:hypothetical protein [Streptomyces griseochromogenes]